MDISGIDILALKLKKDNLKDCNIALYYESDYTESFLYGLIVGKFPNFHKIFQATEENGITVLTKYFLSDGTYKMALSESKLLFNIVSNYPGWNEYSHLIFSIIELLSDFLKFSGCSLEYASFHENMNIFSNIDGVVKFDMVDQLFDGTTLTFPCATKEKAAGNLDVNANVLLRQGIYLNDKKCSLTAIKVETQKTGQLFDASFAMEWVKYLHYVELALYLNIMKESYIRECM